MAQRRYIIAFGSVVRTFCSSSLILLAAVFFALGQTHGNPLRMYLIDLEGGHASLFVAPSGQSLLIDAGNQGGRDTARIMEAIAEAGVKQIDYIVLTHYHVDHIGGLQELSGRIPIRNFIDHGPGVEQPEQLPGFQEMYRSIYAKGSHRIVGPGDKISVPGLDVLVVTSAGEVLKKPLPGAGKPNPNCASFRTRDEEDDENAQSVGLLITLGKFRMINLGDFTWDSEAKLMCPNNPIGSVDLYVTSNHGLDPSGSPVLVHALRPLVVLMHNGPNKGGTPQTMGILQSSPGLQDIWQLHWARAGGIEYNQPGRYIANLEEPAAAAETILHPPVLSTVGGARRRGTPPPGPSRGRGAATGHTPAYWIKMTAQADGSFTVANPRNNFSKTYQGGRWQK